MAAYDSFTAQDKAVIQNAVNLVRAGAGEVCRVFNHLIAIANDTNAVNLILSIDAGTGAGATIPNTSGLAGADDMTRDEVVSLYNYINAIRTNVTTGDTASFRAQASKAAGINALLG